MPYAMVPPGTLLAVAIPVLCLSLPTPLPTPHKPILKPIDPLSLPQPIGPLHQHLGLTHLQQRKVPRDLHALSPF